MYCLATMNKAHKKKGEEKKLERQREKIMLTSLVSEKEQNLQTMMKMHGLHDMPYWIILQEYFLSISSIFILCLVIFILCLVML
nr:abc transporter a family member 5 [Quercus suber]